MVDLIHQNPYNSPDIDVNSPPYQSKDSSSVMPQLGQGKRRNRISSDPMTYNSLQGISISIKPSLSRQSYSSSGLNIIIAISSLCLVVIGGFLVFYIWDRRDSRLMKSIKRRLNNRPIELNSLAYQRNGLIRPSSKALLRPEEVIAESNRDNDLNNDSEVNVMPTNDYELIREGSMKNIRVDILSDGEIVDQSDVHVRRELSGNIIDNQDYFANIRDEDKLSLRYKFNQLWMHKKKHLNLSPSSRQIISSATNYENVLIDRIISSCHEDLVDKSSYDSIFHYLLLPNYVIEQFNFHELFFHGLKRHHTIINSFYGLSLRYTRVLRWFHCCYNILLIFFMNTLFYQLFYPINGTCEEFMTKELCEDKRNGISSIHQLCSWDNSCRTNLETIQSRKYFLILVPGMILCVIAPMRVLIDILFTEYITKVITISPNIYESSRKDILDMENSLTVINSHSSDGMRIFYDSNDISIEVDGMIQSIQSFYSDVNPEGYIPWKDDHRSNLFKYKSLYAAIVHTFQIYPDGTTAPMNLRQRLKYGNPWKRFEVRFVACNEPLDARKGMTIRTIGIRVIS